MLISVYFAFALLAFSDAVQVKYGPQIFTQPQKEYRLYLTPDAVRSFQKDQSSKILEDLSQKSLLKSGTQQSSFQNYDGSQQLQVTQYAKNTDVQEPQGEFRGLLSPSSVYSNGEESSTFDFNKQFTIQNSGEEQQQRLINEYSKSAISQEPQGEFRGLLSPSSLYAKDEQNNNFELKPYSIEGSGERQQQQLLNQYSKSSNSQEPLGEFRGLLSPSSLYSKDGKNNNFDLNKATSIQNTGEEQQQQLINQYIKPSNNEEPQAALKGLFSPSSAYFKEDSNSQGQQSNNYNFNNFYQQQIKQQTIEYNQGKQNIEIQKENGLSQQSQWYPYNPKTAQSQEEALVHEELQKHWNRILDHNRAQLKSFSSVSNENAKVEDANGKAQSDEQAQSNSQIQEQKTETEKQIENIMRNILSNSLNIEQKTETEKQVEYIILKNLQSNTLKNNQNIGTENQLQNMLQTLKENSDKNNQNAETQKQLENILKNIQSISIQNSVNIETLKQMDNILKEIQANSDLNNQGSVIQSQNKYLKSNVQSYTSRNNQNGSTDKQKQQILENAQSSNQKKNVNAEFEKQKEILIKNAQKSSLKNQKSNVEKQIENILKHDEIFEREKEKALAQARAANERPPIIIHKEVSVTKHLPVYKHVKVAVPTPVLVPVPEPYEVKVPHVYPVPLEVVKHIPVPVVRKH